MRTIKHNTKIMIFWKPVMKNGIIQTQEKKILPFYIGVLKEYNFLSFVNEEHIAMMQQNLIFPCICLTSECWDLFETFGKSMTESPYYKIVNLFSKYNIPEKNLHWMVNDFNIEKQVGDLRAKGLKIQSKFFHINAFIIQLIQMNDNISWEIEKLCNKIEYHYLSLGAGHPRHHRYAVTFLLKQKDLLKFGRVSCCDYKNFKFEVTNSTQTSKDIDTDTYIKKFGATQEDVDSFKKILPLAIDNELDTRDIEYNRKNLYDKTFLSVVNESHHTNHEKTFITEKTYNTILQCRPFVINGDRHSLKCLRSIGFQTFSEWFDESYDDAPNDWIRIEKIIKIVQKISSFSTNECSSLYEKMIPVIEHNFNLLVHLGKNEMSRIEKNIDK